MNNYALTISVAQIPVKLVFKQESFYSRINKAYHSFLTNVPADLRLEVETTNPENLSESFGPVPDMTLEQVGYGAGQRDLGDRPNVLRVLVGPCPGPDPRDTITVLETNVDDTSGEIVAYACERLLAAGALDVFTTAIQMKKGRPATQITVLSPWDKTAAMEAILYEETGTFGIRKYDVRRRKLRREAVEVTTPWGAVQGKVGWLDATRRAFSPEFEACRRLAQQKHVPLRAVYEAAMTAWARQADAPEPV